jgi:hypothetical protein
MSMLEWQPHHTIVDGRSDRQDGQLILGEHRRALDVASLADDCVSDSEKSVAAEAWGEGMVALGDREAHGATTLVIPFPALTDALVREAISRFRP